MRIEGKQTYDCEPTLTDSQVLAFCKEGFLLLPGVVPERVNQQCMDYLNGYGRSRSLIAGAEVPSGEPSEILLEEWFVDGVITAPVVAGAVRSRFRSSISRHCPRMSAAVGIPSALGISTTDTHRGVQ